jgi:hypothetical protein
MVELLLGELPMNNRLPGQFSSKTLRDRGM